MCHLLLVSARLSTSHQQLWPSLTSDVPWGSISISLSSLIFPFFSWTGSHIAEAGLEQDLLPLLPSVRFKGMSHCDQRGSEMCLGLPTLPVKGATFIFESGEKASPGSLHPETRVSRTVCCTWIIRFPLEVEKDTSCYYVHLGHRTGETGPGKRQ